MYRVALAMLALVAGATSASAQSMRSFSTFRQLHGETRLQVGLDYRAGGAPDHTGPRQRALPDGRIVRRGPLCAHQHL